jgi:hypothetical protein
VVQFDATRAGANDAGTNAIVCTQHSLRRREGGGKTARHRSDKFTA